MIVYINIVCFFLNWSINPINKTVVQIPNVPPDVSAGFLSNCWLSAARLRSAGGSDIGNSLGRTVDIDRLPIGQSVLVGGALLVTWSFYCSAQERFQDQNQKPWTLLPAAGKLPGNNQSGSHSSSLRRRKQEGGSSRGTQLPPRPSPSSPEGCWFVGQKLHKAEDKDSEVTAPKWLFCSLL